jgi:hypothetical protein
MAGCGARSAGCHAGRFPHPGMPELTTAIVAALRKGLSETGFVERRNVAIEFRFA